MGQHWRLAAIYADTLNRVVTEGQQAARDATNGINGTQSNSKPPARSFKQMRKAAYELSVSLSRRQSNTNATAGQSENANAITGIERTPQANEMEYLDVFEFFNYPLIAGVVPDDYDVPMAGSMDGVGNLNGDRSESVGRLKSPTFVIPTRESDWLGFQPPHE